MSEFTETEIESMRRRFAAYAGAGAPNECWPWLGPKLKKDGRGTLCVGRKGSVTAPRMAWFVQHGEWPQDGVFVCHSCDNPNCINPAHLWLGSCLDNTRDAAQKGLLKIPIGIGESNSFAKLTVEGISQAAEWRRQGLTITAIGVRLGVSRSTISAVFRRKSWKTLDLGNYLAACEGKPFMAPGE